MGNHPRAGGGRAAAACAGDHSIGSKRPHRAETTVTCSPCGIGRLESRSRVGSRPRSHNAPQPPQLRRRAPAPPPGRSLGRSLMVESAAHVEHVDAQSGKLPGKAHGRWHVPRGLASVFHPLCGRDAHPKRHVLGQDGADGGDDVTQKTCAVLIASAVFVCSFLSEWLSIYGT